MTMIRKRAISRRAVLKGAGVALALPFLDAMVPPLAAAAATKPTRRLGIIYVPNGMVMPNWTPKTDGVGYELSPILSPLEPFRDHFTVISGLAHRQADSLGDGSGDHARGGGSYLTGVHVKRSEGVVEGGVSMDQLAAKAFENETQISSLELSLDANDVVGSCDFGYSCAYTNTIAWRTPSMPLIPENDPRVVFERLFGASDSTAARARMERLRRNHSILDFVLERVKALQRDLGAGDQRKLSDYMEAIRDVERRIEKAEAQGESTTDLATVDRPSGIPDTFEEHARLMFDLQVLAYQCDLTRVITFMIGRELSPRTYPQLGIPDAHHGLSHHAEDPEKLAKLTLLQTHHVRQLAYFLEKLAATPDGEGTLLDNVMLTYGGALSNSDRHYHFDLPLLLIGGGGGAFRGGRHIRYPEDTPMANLHLTMLDKLGVRMDRLGDSNGMLVGLSDL